MGTVQYYYLLSSLPGLRLGQPLPMTEAEFIGCCEAQLEAVALARLRALALVPTGQPACQFQRCWENWETCLRNAMVALRSARQGIQPEIWQQAEQDVFPGALRTIEEALAISNPAQREFRLDELRWQFIDDLMVGHEFDLTAVMGYRLHLLLAAKWHERSVAVGREALQALVALAVRQAVERRTVGD